MVTNGLGVDPGRECWPRRGEGDQREGCVTQRGNVDLGEER
jgi:hypothetical protein